MRDKLTKARRSWNMSRIRGKNTTPELRVRSLLHKMGFRFRVHVRIPIPRKLSTFNLKLGTSKLQPSTPKQFSAASSRSATFNFQPSTFKPRTLFVRPDILLPKYKTAIFVHGYFLHRRSPMQM